jgi:hypothetical protein
LRFVTRIDKAIIIDRPLDVVFDYITTPRNWLVWHPSSLAVSGAIDHSAAPGEKIEEEFVVAGFHGKASWIVVTREAPRLWVIDGVVELGGGGTIRYFLSPANGGTQFKREFIYHAPNLLFIVLDELWIRTRIDGESATALKQLKAVLESR